MSVELQGHRFDVRTKDMIERLIWKTGLDLVISQGSYSTSVGASGGTHAGGGAVDISVRNLSLAEQEQVELVGRQIGFAIWIRQPIPGLWTKHIHGIAMECVDLSNSAEQQVRDYRNGRNGLSGRSEGPDDGPSGYRNTTWEKYQAAHPDEELLMATGDEILAAIAAEAQRNTARESVYLGRYTDIKGDIAEVKAVQELEKGRYTDLKGDVSEVKAALAALATKVDALPKA